MHTVCVVLLSVTAAVGLVMAPPRVVGLDRYAVKGLSADALRTVSLEPGDCFPHDRRYAMLYSDRAESFDSGDPEHLHKANFMCGKFALAVAPQSPACP